MGGEGRFTTHTPPSLFSTTPSQHVNITCKTEVYYYFNELLRDFLSLNNFYFVLYEALVKSGISEIFMSSDMI